MENYEVVSKIGSGACGAVYLVRSKMNGRQSALKKVQLDEQKRTRTREALLREARILAKLKHPHIVAYHDSFFAANDDNNFIHIVQDYCDGGTLDEKISEKKAMNEFFEEKLIMEWFIQIAMAVQYIHSHRILHRDLKAQNVFLTKTDGVKLGDFGIAKVLDSTLDAAVTCVGTPCYLSPELCQDIPYSSKADIWALGCLLYEIAALRPAFDAHNLISLFYKITKAEYAVMPDRFSQDLKSLIKAILVKNPEERPSAGALLNLHIVKKYLELFIKDKEYLLRQKIILRSKSGVSNQEPNPLVTTDKNRPSSVSQSATFTARASHISPRAIRRSLSERSRPQDDTRISRDDGIKTASHDPDGETRLHDSVAYPDDFNSSSSSDDEIPEELTDYIRNNKSQAPRNNSHTSDYDQPAANRSSRSEDEEPMEEETPNDVYVDDFEEDSEAEELGLIVNHAKEAHTLQTCGDEFFVDEEHRAIPLTILRDLKVAHAAGKGRIEEETSD